MRPTPKDNNIYVLDSLGSTYTYSEGPATFTALSDAGELSNGTGNGLAYYDNYIYIAKNTTVARYGPLDGVPKFVGDYWVGVLGKAQLDNTAVYPKGPAVPGGSGKTFPNHFLHRHSDEKLYIADVTGNQGTIHYIATTKTTVEGDTDNGSTFSKISFGYGLYPTAIESYGSSIAIAFWEGGVPQTGGFTNQNSGRAKIAFWDTTSQNANSIIWVEFPDGVISSMKNANGTLYVASGDFGFPQSRFRVSRFIGGYTVEEVFYNETGAPPYPGAMDATANNLIFGGYAFAPDTAGCLFSYGLRKAALGQGLFKTARITGNAQNMATAVIARGTRAPLIAFGNLFGGSTGGIDTLDGTDYSTANQIWWSNMFRIGQPFKITKIRTPLGQAVAANMIVTPKFYMDDSVTTYTGGASAGLAIINNANYPGLKNIVMRPQNMTGDHNFYLELKWTGSALCVVNLPITIEYELVDD